MRRLFWLVMGVTIGALVVRKLSRVAGQLTPRGIAQNVGGGLAEVSESIRDFAGNVRDHMHERETTLRTNTGIDGSFGTMGSGDTP